MFPLCVQRLVRFSCTSAPGGFRYAEAVDSTFTKVRPFTPPSYESLFDASHTMEFEPEIEIAKTDLMCPIAPPNIICIGLNYRSHSLEVGHNTPVHPVVFMKATTAATGPYDDIEIPYVASNPPECDYEVELGVIIGKKVKEMDERNASSAIAGFVTANDISARRWQGQHRGGGQWCLAKSMDGFCPFGPGIVRPDLASSRGKTPGAGLIVTSTVNAEKRQKASTDDMIWSAAALVAFLSSCMTLLPGTLILTGTPSGVGLGLSPPKFLVANDVVACSVERVGTISNKFVACAD